MARELPLLDIFLSANAHSLIWHRLARTADWIGSRRFLEMQPAAPMLIAS
jgi:hypothetical protein